MATSKTPPRPTSLKIGYMEFEVRYLDDGAWLSDPNLGPADGGQCDGARALISVRLAEDQHDIHVKEILFHEVLHACFYACGISVNDDIRTYLDIEEGIVCRITPVLLDVMRTNPGLSKFLES